MFIATSHSIFLRRFDRRLLGHFAPTELGTIKVAIL